MARQLKTSWMKIATSGASVDNRTIEKEWLLEMAEHYNPDLYTALIWPDHQRYFSNVGKVLALKTEPATTPGLEGEIHLLAILAPNDGLIEANKRGQYIFTSIEVAPDFRGKGHFYLDGLAVTDSPASAGTSELRFNKSHPDNYVRAGVEIGLHAEFEKNTPNSITDQDDTMTPEQMAQLQDGLSAHIDDHFSKLAKSGDGETPPETPVITAEQFSTLETENAELKGQVETLTGAVGELKEEFEKIKTEEVPGTPAGENTGEEKPQAY